MTGRSTAGRVTSPTTQPNSRDKGTPVARVLPGEAPDRAIARTLMAPSTQAAATIRTLERSDYEIDGFIAELQAQIAAVHSGDMDRAEAILIAQAHTLDDLFNVLARRAALNIGEYLGAAETYFRLALKAQSQCRATLETLSNVKNPPIVYARQANVTTGPQQVNNGIPARENETEQSKLLETQHGEWLDTGAAGASGGIDSDLEAVGAVDRAKNAGG